MRAWKEVGNAFGTLKLNYTGFHFFLFDIFLGVVFRSGSTSFARVSGGPSCFQLSSDQLDLSRLEYAWSELFVHVVYYFPKFIHTYFD